MIDTLDPDLGVTGDLRGENGPSRQWCWRFVCWFLAGEAAVVAAVVLWFFGGAV